MSLSSSEYPRPQLAVEHFVYIDVLRGVAIAAAIFNFGQMGVQLFFIASAITLCASTSQRRGSNPRNFYLRRFFRIAPMYYTAIIGYFIWRSILHYVGEGEIAVPFQYTPLAITENIFFIHGLDPQNYNSVVPGGWSISAEMLFYLIFPVLFSVLNQAGVKVFAFLALATCVVIFCIQFAIINADLPRLSNGEAVENNEFGFLYASFPNQISVFMIGMIAYTYLGSKLKQQHLLLAALILLLACIIQNNRSLDTGMDGFFYPILCAIPFSIIAVWLSSRALPNSASVSILASIGKYSYSIYIIHFVVVDVIRFTFIHTGLIGFVGGTAGAFAIFVTSLMLSYIGARIAWLLVERPGIELGRSVVSRLQPAT